MIEKEKLIEFYRFGIVGCLSVAIQYIVYLLLIDYMNETIANTIGYIVSF